MATEQTVLQYIGRALWDPTPTDTSDLRARQLAAALGYPTTFRVVRSIEDIWKSEKGNKWNERCIVDRIYAGKPGSGCDMWYHHEGAMKAVSEFYKRQKEKNAEDDDDDDEEEPTPFSFDGGHMLPKQPLFHKGDKVQVMHGASKWKDATILRHKEEKNGDFTYQVQYDADGKKQSKVDEETIRPMPEAPDPKKVAIELGFDDGWEAFETGKNKWKILAPDGQKFTSKKKALDHFNKLLAELGDPPWRTVGSKYLGKRVIYTIEHKPSSRRTVKIEQHGKVTGWISETDVDRAGEPGFVSEKTGQPARLYHVDFEEDPLYHPYGSALLQGQDFEEYELEAILEEKEEDQDEAAAAADVAASSSPPPPQKKARTS